MIKVGVIRGGTDSGYEASLASGGFVLSQLRNENLNSTYLPIDIFIDKDGIWHTGGVPTNISEVSEKVDIIFNALHGDFGQNGEIQQLLEKHNIPYTGSDSSACSLVCNRATLKEELSKAGISVPSHILYSAYFEDLDGPIEKYSNTKARDVIKRLPPPWVVKPLTRGSSMDTFVCRSIQDLINAISVGAHQNVSILVEEKIEGRSTQVSVINNFRGKDVYSLLCSGNFSFDEKREAEKLAKIVHEKLGLKNYSQSDLIITPKKEIFVVEVNAFPELHEESIIHKHAEDVGLRTSDFIDHIIGLSK